VTEGQRQRDIAGVGLAAALFVFVYGVGLWVVPMLAASAGLSGAAPWLARSGLLTQITFLVMSAALAYAVGRGNLARFGCKWVGPRQWVRPVLVSVAAMLAVMVIVGPLTMALFGPPTGRRGPGPEGLAQTVIFVWIVASTCEEVFYRGLLQGVLAPLARLQARIGSVRLSLPVALCAVAFGLGHLCLLGRVPVQMLTMILISTTTLGFIAGYYRERTQSIIPAIGAHMTFNIVGTLVPLLLARSMPG
jgi:membrane protease YdiL (CAAX protease family)